MATNITQNGLSAENEAFIDHIVEGGTYQSRGDVLNAGVELLRQRIALLERLKEGRRQLDEGEYYEYDDAGLDELFSTLRNRVKERSQQ